MSSNGRSNTTIILTTAALILAALAGLIISMASGSKPGRNTEAWTPPPTSATATRMSRPTATATLIPTATRPPATATLMPTATRPPTKAPATPTSPAAVRAQNTVTPSPSASAQPKPDQAQTPASAPIAIVRQDPLSIRLQPSTSATLIALAQAGDTYTVLGRTADNVWLQVCCVNNLPAWLAAAYVDVTGPISSVPIIQP